MLSTNSIPAFMVEVVWCN